MGPARHTLWSTPQLSHSLLGAPQVPPHPHAKQALNVASALQQLPRSWGSMKIAHVVLLYFGKLRGLLPDPDYKIRAGGPGAAGGEDMGASGG